VFVVNIFSFSISHHHQQPFYSLSTPPTHNVWHSVFILYRVYQGYRPNLGKSSFLFYGHYWPLLNWAMFLGSAVSLPKTDSITALSKSVIYSVAVKAGLPHPISAYIDQVLFPHCISFWIEKNSNQIKVFC